MKIKSSSSFQFRVGPGLFSRPVPLNWGVGLALLAISATVMAGESPNRELRELGYAGAYTGVIRGNISSRTSPGSAFTSVPVSELVTEALPQANRQKIESPFGSGTSYLLFVKTVVNRRRAVIRGLYYGQSFNPALGAVTVRSGTKVLQVERNARRGSNSPMTLSDNMREYNTSGDLLAQWRRRGTLEK
jgi:hypothetical protein